jgi:hypothetical protein
MGTPIRKEFGPGYDSPPRKFHFLAVILPTVVLIALAVALMRGTASTSSKLTRSPIVSCPKQMCPAPGATQSVQPAKTTSAAGLSVAETTASDSSSPAVTSASGRASSRPSSPSPSSNLSPAQTSPSPGSPASPSASPVLPATRALLSQSSPAVTHAVLLSSA